MFDWLHRQLIKCVVGKKPVIMNVEFETGIKIKGIGVLLINNKWLKPAPSTPHQEVINEIEKLQKFIAHKLRYSRIIGGEISYEIEMLKAFLKGKRNLEVE